mmetsp:Transcript_42596/g.121420  ORF Transcript_42596/g.121420 Transcript_42596/m.121420 type:complete len:469 (+) Transcript_42596:64-1470(+)
MTSPRAELLSDEEGQAGEGAEAGRLQVALEFGDSPELCPLSEAVQKLLEREPRRGPAKASPVLFAHRFPESPVMYGGWFGQRRAPCVFIEAPCKEVLAYVQDDPLGPFVDIGKKEHWERCGFTQDTQESMFKLDWHAVPHLGPEADLFVPRAAKRGRLPRAPPRILAFIMAFRAVNQGCWSVIVDALRGLKLAREAAEPEYAGSPRAKLLGTLIECFKNGRHLGVVEAQVRWGEKDCRMPSHKDGATSLLHLGLTLGGERTFRAGVFGASDSAGNSPPRAGDGKATRAEADPERNIWDLERWRPEHLREILMTPGAAYLSSPFLFEHGVEYDAESSQESPIIALQCRFAYPNDLGRHLNNLRDADVAEIAEVVAEVLKSSSESARLRMPSLNEVIKGEARVKQIRETEAAEQEKQRLLAEEERQRKKDERSRREEDAQRQVREQQEAMRTMLLHGWMHVLATQVQQGR